MRLIDADELERDIWDSGIENGDEFAYLVRTSKTVNSKEIVKSQIPLKNCPFCGRRPEWGFKEISGKMCVIISCELCGCQTKLFSDSDDPSLENPSGKSFFKAARAWNRRFSESNI